MKLFRTIVSTKNLKLAWRRINTATNIQYKRFFRPIYLAYETGLEENLLRLREDLIADNWQPKSPTRLYLPKPNGLQRPITLLHLEDQIVLQAVANIFAKKLKAPRSKIELDTVFSHVLNKEKDSIFFIQQWQRTYHKFVQANTMHFQNGYRWIAHFDLAAYYDTISHTQLVAVVSPRRGNADTWDRVKGWLETWTTYDGSPRKNHGIPQGPAASAFLSEAFFLPIDNVMSKLGVKYTRYVDDIRLFGKTQLDVQKATLRLERECQNHGLIPQSRKFAICEAKSIDEVLGQLPSIPPEKNDDQEEITKENAEKMFRESIEGSPRRISDKSRARYVLYRAPKSEKILRGALSFVISHPEHIDAINAYLSQYNKSIRIVRAFKSALETGVPYPYLRAQLWHTLARAADKKSLLSLRPMAIKELRDISDDIAHRWGLLHFLIRCEKEGIGKGTNRLLSQHEFTQALLVQYLPDKEFAKDRIAHKILKQKKLESSLALARVMSTLGQSLSKDYKMQSSGLNNNVQNVFREIGLIQRRRLKNKDYIGEELHKLYGVLLCHCWYEILGPDYNHGLQLIVKARASYYMDRSGWMRNQNSFNDMVVRGFKKALNHRGLPGGKGRLVEVSGRLVKFGVLVQSGQPLDRAYPISTEAMREFNRRRNKLPGSHPYDENTGNKNPFLGLQERDKFHKSMKDCFSDVIAACKAHGISN